MASADHAHNLEMILPAIERLLDRNDHVRFELFGSIPVPDCLLRFGERVSTAPPIKNYGSFLKKFADSGWDIGICPLSPIGFNFMKANTKWVEYTAIGAAVVASRGTVYDDCRSDGCGILADTVEEWFSALDLLINNVDERLATVERAQAKLERDYSVARLRGQVLEVIAQAHGVVRARLSGDRREVSVCQIR
jgi:glycosyltransferase involved in cell wall biosynthesis